MARSQASRILVDMNASCGGGKGCGGAIRSNSLVLVRVEKNRIVSRSDRRRTFQFTQIDDVDLRPDFVGGGCESIVERVEEILSFDAGIRGPFVAVAENAFEVGRHFAPDVCAGSRGE